MSSKNQKSSPNNRLRLTALFREFFESGQSAGVLLIICTLISLLVANSNVSAGYLDFWKIKLGANFGDIHMEHTIGDWINDGLMTIFFLLVGLEIERELYIGELSDRKRAMLPVMGAIGGMLIPALTYFLFNMHSPETLSGIGIPTATDIAFAIALMGLLGNRVPVALKVFLTALAIIDDLGAILVIAIFYGHGISWLFLGLSAALTIGLFILGKRGVNSLWVYIPLGLVLWFFMMQSGIHATLAGVILAFAIPFEGGKPQTVSYRLQHHLHRPVSFLILPIFALANTAIVLSSDVASELLSTESLGIFFGLVLGKPIGIFLAAWIADKLGWARIPNNVSLAMLWGAGMLAGIGFTMSIFITNLAFNDPHYIDLGKISILIASTVAAVGGYVFLRNASK